MRAVKQALRLELGLELLEGDLKIAGPLRLQRRAVELICSVARIDGHAPEGRDAHTALGTEAQL